MLASLSYLFGKKSNININNINNGVLLDADNSKYKNILEFLPKTTDNIIILDENKKDLVCIIKSFCDKQSVKKFVISLSGGVDSMVLITILKFLGHKVIGAHINYNNRNESKDEQQFLEQWCKKNDIVLYTEVIDTIKRGTMKRSTYELESKNIRFSFYNRVLELEKCKMILLGHQKDDIVENIFANVCRGRSILDLAVIKEETTQNDVTIARPMIDIYKTDIYDFANKYQVPYFKDSTPPWTIRGKYRNQISPLLKETFTENIKKNLLSLSRQSDEWNEMISKEIIDPFMKTVNFTSRQCTFNTENACTKPMCFWNIVFMKIFNYYGKGYPSKKGIQTFMNLVPSIGTASISHSCICKIKNYNVTIEFKN